MAVMTPTILSKPPWPGAPTPHPPEWILDKTLLKLLYYKVHWYRAKGQPSKRLEYVAPPFEHYTVCQVTPIDVWLLARKNITACKISFLLRVEANGIRRDSFIVDGIDGQLRLVMGIDGCEKRGGYNGSPLVSRYWHKLRVLFVKMRPIAMYWLEQTVKRTMQSEFTEPGNIYSSGIPIGAGAISEKQCFEEMDMH